MTKLTEKPSIDVICLTCDPDGAHDIAVDTTRSPTSTSDLKKEDAMVTLLLIAVVASYLLLATYALSWPHAMPR